jgi:hypothetical protein
LALGTDQSTYISNQVVRITLTITNSGNVDVTLLFRSSQEADFVIRRGEEEIWRWSDGRIFAQSLTQMKLRPSEQREIHVSWDQKDREGRAVLVGSYDVLGLILVGGRRDRAGASFRIVAQTGSDHFPSE